MPEPAIDRMLAMARARIGPRVQASDLHLEFANGSLVVDVRPIEQRTRDGDLPGAVVIDRNVLEWRLDPTCPYRLAGIDEVRRVVVVCNEGYSSSLAAAGLVDLGLPDVTDLDGGFQAWLASTLTRGADEPLRHGDDQPGGRGP